MANEKIMNRRLIAGLIDLAILAVINAGLILLFLFVLNFPLIVSVITPAVVVLAYQTVFHMTSSGATPGMKQQRLVITDDNGYAPKPSRVLLRNVLMLLTCIPFGFGFFYGYADKKHQTVYDYASCCSVQLYTRKVVVRNKNYIPVVTARMENGKTEKYCVDEDGLAVGRDPKNCDVLFSNDCQTVSRRHCVVKFNTATNLFTVTDVGSSCGTYLANGKRIDRDALTVILPGTVLYLGSRRNALTLKVVKRG